MTIRDLLILIGSLALGLGLVRGIKIALPGTQLLLGMTFGLSYAFPILLWTQRRLAGRRSRLFVGEWIGLATATIWVLAQTFYACLYVLSSFPESLRGIQREFFSLGLWLLLGFAFAHAVIDLLTLVVLLRGVFRRDAGPRLPWTGRLGIAIPFVPTLLIVIPWAWP